MSAAQLLQHLKRSGTGPGKTLAVVPLVCVLMSVLGAAPTDNRQKPTQESPTDSAARSSQSNSDADQLRKKVEQLTAELTRIKKRVAELEKDRQVDTLQDRLGKEEQRAEVLQAQLLGTTEKEAASQARMDQLEEQLRPENLDRALAGVGSLHPEDAREALRRRLSSENRRIQSQLDLLHQDHARLQSSLADSDAAIQRLRLRLMEATHP